MIGPGLKKLASQRGFEKTGNCIFGIEGGYSVTVCDTLGYKKLSVGIALDEILKGIGDTRCRHLLVL